MSSGAIRARFRMSFIFNRVQNRFLFSLGLLFVFFMAIIFYILFKSAQDRFDAQLASYEESGQSVALNLAENVQFGVMTADREIIKEKVEQIIKDPKVSWILVTDEQNDIIYEQFRSGVEKDSFELDPIIGKQLDTTVPITQETLRSKTGEPFLTFWVPITLEIKGGGMDSEPTFIEQAAPVQLGSIILGMNLKDIYRQRASSRTSGIIAMAAMAIVLIGVLWYLVRRVTQPIVTMADMARKVGKGDLTVEIPVRTDDELGLLASTMNEMIAGIREQIDRSTVLIDNIADAVSTLTSTTDQIFQISAQQATGATEQASTIQETASTSKEIAATASRIAEGAQEVTNIARRTSDAAQDGKNYLKNTTEGMELINDRVKTVSQRILELGEQSQQIGGVIDIINEISEQTNMLALNAAIEAVGAGESGRRFSVVAAEVRRLANRTLEATRVVSEMIERIQDLTNTTVMLNEEEIKAVAAGVEAVSQLGEKFTHILDMVDSTTRAASEITLSTQQQSTASEQMVTSVMEVNEVAVSVEKGAKDIESAMKDLKNLGDRLRALVEEKA